MLAPKLDFHSNLILWMIIKLLCWWIKVF